MLAAKFFSSSHDEDQEVSWSQNPTVYKHAASSREDELGQILSPVTILLHTLATFDGP